MYMWTYAQLSKWRFWYKLRFVHRHCSQTKNALLQETVRPIRVSSMVFFLLPKNHAAGSKLFQGIPPESWMHNWYVQSRGNHIKSGSCPVERQRSKGPHALSFHRMGCRGQGKLDEEFLRPKKMFPKRSQKWPKKRQKWSKLVHKSRWTC